MSDEMIIRTVNELRGLEGCSLLQRLIESSTYVPPGESALFGELEAMAAEEKEHLHRLDDLLDALDATPGPRRVCAESSNLHYNRAHVLIPRLIADKRQLIAAYETASSRCAGDPRASEVISGILSSHRQQTARLESMQQTAAH